MNGKIQVLSSNTNGSLKLSDFEDLLPLNNKKKTYECHQSVLQSYPETCSEAPIIPSSQAFSWRNVEFPIKVTGRKKRRKISKCVSCSHWRILDKVQSFQLSTMGSLLTRSARRARTRAPGASVAWVYNITRMKCTGAAQVMQPGKSVRARLPVSDAIIVPLDSMIISPQCPMVGSVHHLKRWVGRVGGGGGLFTAVTSQMSERQLSFSLCFGRVASIHGLSQYFRWNHLTLISASKILLDYVIKGPPPPELKSLDVTAVFILTTVAANHFNGLKLKTNLYII